MLWSNSPVPVGESYIDIVTLPNKLIYGRGQAIDITGLVVHLYDENGVDMGVIPNRYLTHTATASLRSGMTASSSHGNALVTTGNTIISENNGSRSPITKTNSGYAACLIGENALGDQYGGNWFVYGGISDTAAKAEIRTPTTSLEMKSFNIHNLTYYLSTCGTNRDWGGATTTSNPLGIPKTVNYQWASPNESVSEQKFKYLLRYANVLFVGEAVTISYRGLNVQYGIEVSDILNARFRTKIENYNARLSTTITTSIDNYDTRLNTSITTSIDNYYE
jgi:hypothetical protein